MTALDDAIARHATHGAATGADPLTDSLGEQQQFGAYAPDVPLREGWETEPIEVRFPRWGVALCLLLAIVGSLLLSGCGGGGDDEDPPPPGVDCKARPELCK